MKTIKHRLLFALLLLFVTLGTLASAFGQITPSQDSYTNSAAPATNHGAAATLGVVSSSASIQTTCIQFDLSSIPAWAKATLRLFVNGVTTAGRFNVELRQRELDGKDHLGQHGACAGLGKTHLRPPKRSRAMVSRCTSAILVVAPALQVSVLASLTATPTVSLGTLLTPSSTGR